MKTAVSIPDGLFKSAEGFARRRGMSRSKLYARALREYLEGQAAEGITEILDEVYGPEGEAGALTPALARLQGASLPRDGGWRPEGGENVSGREGEPEIRRGEVSGGQSRPSRRPPNPATAGPCSSAPRTPSTAVASAP